VLPTPFGTRAGGTVTVMVSAEMPWRERVTPPASAAKASGPLAFPKVKLIEPRLTEVPTVPSEPTVMLVALSVLPPKAAGRVRLMLLTVRPLGSSVMGPDCTVKPYSARRCGETVRLPPNVPSVFRNRLFPVRLSGGSPAGSRLEGRDTEAKMTLTPVVERVTF